MRRQKRKRKAQLKHKWLLRLKLEPAQGHSAHIPLATASCMVKPNTHASSGRTCRVTRQGFTNLSNQSTYQNSQQDAGSYLYGISNLVNLSWFSPQCPNSALNISEFLSLNDKAHFSSDGDEPSIDLPPQMMAFLHSKLSGTHSHFHLLNVSAAWMWRWVLLMEDSSGWPWIK